MTPQDLFALLPADKLDTENAERLVALGYPAVAPVVPKLVAWQQDFNWPVAQVLRPFLVTIGAALAPEARRVLAGEDSVWKYWLLQGIVRESPQLAEELKSELLRLRRELTQDDEVEGVSIVASQILETLGGTTEA